MKANSSLIITRADNGWRLDLECYGPCVVGAEPDPNPRSYHLVFADGDVGKEGLLDAIEEELDADKSEDIPH